MATTTISINKLTRILETLSPLIQRRQLGNRRRTTADDKRPPGITTEQMLAIREHVRERLIHDIHVHTLTARLYRNVDNIPMSKVEQATVKELQAMLNSLANETEPMKGTSVRLMENE
jgi:hypothetical protein